MAWTGRLGLSTHRYLDISFRLPERVRDLEPERDLAAARVSRGKVATLHAAPACRPLRVETSLIVWRPATRSVWCGSPPGALAEQPVDDDLRKATIDGFAAVPDNLGEHRQAQGKRLAFVIDDRMTRQRLVGELRTLAAHNDRECWNGCASASTRSPRTWSIRNGWRRRWSCSSRKPPSRKSPTLRLGQATRAHPQISGSNLRLSPRAPSSTGWSGVPSIGRRSSSSRVPAGPPQRSAATCQRLRRMRR